MPYWSAAFLVIAATAAGFGLAGAGGAAGETVWVLACVGLILSAISMLLRRPFP